MSPAQHKQYSRAQQYACQVLHFPSSALLLPQQRLYESSLIDLVIPHDLYTYPFIITAPNNHDANITDHVNKLANCYPVSTFLVITDTGQLEIWKQGVQGWQKSSDQISTPYYYHSTFAHAPLRKGGCADQDYMAIQLDIVLAALIKVMDPESAFWLINRLLHGLALTYPSPNEWQQPHEVLITAMASSYRVLPLFSAEKEWETPLPQQKQVLEELAIRLSTLRLSAIEYDLLAPLYEKVVARGTRRKFGAFMTPPQVVDLVIWLAGAAQITPEGELVATARSLATIEEKGVLDPAAGTGTFIVRLLALARRTGNQQAVAELLIKLYAVEMATLPAFTLCINAAIQWALTSVDARNSLPALHMGQGDALLTYTPFNKQMQLKLAMNIESTTDWWQALQERDDFSLVIGNPPYVGESGNKQLFALYRQQTMWVEHTQGKMDFLQFFIILGLSKLQHQEGGRLCFITSAYWLTAQGASKLRQLILSQACIHTIIYFNNKALFAGAPGHDSIIILLERCSSSTCRAANRIRLVEVNEYEHPLINQIAAGLAGKQEGVHTWLSALPQGMLTSKPWHLRVDESDLKVLTALEKETPLKCGFCVRQGLAPGAQRVDRAALTYMGADWVQRHNITLGEGVFVLNEDEITNLPLTEHEKTFLRPFVKNSAIKPYAVLPEQSLWLIYLHYNHECIDCQNLLTHLSRFRPLLQRKRELEKGLRKWYHLHWPRTESIFNDEKVMTAQRGERPTFAWSNQPIYAATDVYFIQPKPGGKDTNISLLGLTGILNSSLSNFWFNHRAKTQGKQREFFGKTIEEFPLPIPDLNQAYYKKLLCQLESNVEQLHRWQLIGDYTQHAWQNKESQIDEVVFQLYALPTSLQAHIHASTPRK